MAFERSRRCELSQFVSDHVLRDVDRNVPFAIVYAKGQPHHIGRNRRSPRPCLDHLRTLRSRAHALNHFANALVDPGPFFN